MGNPRHAPGTRVRLIQEADPEDPDELVESALEYGVVSWTWWDEQMKCWDCWVSFFGDQRPEENKPLPKPYMLRYFAASLTLGWE